MSHPKRVGHRFSRLAPGKLGLQLSSVRFMHHIPEFLRPARPSLDRYAGPVFDLFRNETEGEVRSLAEEHAGPFAAEKFDLRLGTERARVKFAAGFFLVQIFVPGTFSQFVNGRQAAGKPKGTDIIDSRYFDAVPMTGFNGCIFKVGGGKCARLLKKFLNFLLPSGAAPLQRVRQRDRFKPRVSRPKGELVIAFQDMSVSIDQGRP
jgi:hypothetical protein